MLTQTAKYAISALLFLSENEDVREHWQARDIASAIGVPSNYLGKTLQRLAAARILESQKGLHGGFRLARPVGRITLEQILIAIEAIPRPVADDMQATDDELPWGVYAKLAEMTRHYNQFLQRTTLQHLVRSARSSPVRAGV